MSEENAFANLIEFGKTLNIDEELKFDQDKTCILGIDDQFSMHLTFEPTTDRLYVYSPLNAGEEDSLPKNQTRYYPDPPHVHKSILRQTYYTHAATGYPPTVRTYRTRTQLALFVL